MEEYGLIIGLGLLCAVGVCAFLLGRQAVRSIERFRDEHHERFKGRQES